MKRLVFAISVTVAALVYWTPLDLRDGRDLEAHGLNRPVSTYQTTPERPLERNLEPVPTVTSVPATTTTTIPAPPASAKCPQWWPEIRKAGWPEEHYSIVDLIMWRESRCLPEARSKTSDSGLMQINDMHRPLLAGYGLTPADLFDPFLNLYAARIVSDLARSYGWSPFQPWSATYP
jgi:soluble lytic murein transglycosylase-like protein